jgi:hypothetical protein
MGLTRMSSFAAGFNDVLYGFSIHGYIIATGSKQYSVSIKRKQVQCFRYNKANAKS